MCDVICISGSDSDDVAMDGIAEEKPSFKNSLNVKGAKTEVRTVISANSIPMMKKSQPVLLSPSKSSTPKKRKLETVSEIVILDSDEENPEVKVQAESKQRIKPEKISECVKHVSKDDSLESQLSKLFTELLSTSGSELTIAEKVKLEQKFGKRLQAAATSNDRKSLKNLIKFVQDQTEYLGQHPANAIKVIAQIFGQMDLLKKDTKSKAEEKNEKELNATAAGSSQGGSSPGEIHSSESIAKRKRTLARLEKALAECNKKILKLEQQELNLDDLDCEDSAYIQTERYRAHCVKIFKRIAKLKEQDPRLGRYQDKKFKIGDASRFPDVNRKIERLISKRSLKKKFPDFIDIFNLFLRHNEKHKLGFPKETLKNEALSTFQIVGSKLKTRRIQDEDNDLMGYLPEDSQPNPADQDPELASKLKESAQIREKKIDTIVDEFVLHQAERQKAKSEGVTKTIPESPEKNEDDDVPEMEGNSDVESGDESDSNEVDDGDSDRTVQDDDSNVELSGPESEGENESSSEDDEEDESAATPKKLETNNDN